VHCLHLQAGAFTRRLNKEKGGSLCPENVYLGRFKVVLARAGWVTGILDRDVIRPLSMLIVKTAVAEGIIALAEIGRAV
jgi:hypothetical protein